MNQAINAYYTITASSEFREKERLHEKARHDEAQALHNAERKGERKGARKAKMEIARKLLKRGRPIDEVAEVCRLSREEVESLRSL